MTKQRQRVLLVIADNHPVFLQGLAIVFQSQPNIKIVAQCADGLSAMEAIRKHSPDIAMIDISMPGLSGFDILAAVNAERRETRILFLTASISGLQIMDAVSNGANGVIFKSSSPEEIARSVRRVAVGKYQFPKNLAEAVRKRWTKRPTSSQSPNTQLTPRESEVSQLVVQGFSNKEIGRQMQLREGTVKIHLHNIYKKLKISNRTSLATFMIGRR